MSHSSIPHHRGWSDSGSSLIEVLIAALILASGVLAMLRLFSLAAASNVDARAQTVAMILAQQKLEQLRSDDLQTSSGVDHLDGNGSIVGLDGQAPAQSVYTRQWSIEPVSGDASAGFFIQVQVRVKGEKQPVELATMKALQ